jgi:hypothetical protein
MADENPSVEDDGDARVETILRDYLSTRLDGQLGRAAAHFHRHLGGHNTGTGGSPPGAGPSTRRRHHYNAGGGWVIGIVGSALAASIAALWAGPSLRLYTPTPGTPGAPGATQVASHDAGAAGKGTDLEMDELTLLSQTRDGGTVVLDGRTPARRLIRRELKQERWVDPRTGASLEIIEPRQDVMFIQLETY